MSITYIPTAGTVSPLDENSSYFWSAAAAGYDREAMRDRDRAEQWRAEARYCRGREAALVIEAQRLELEARP